MRSLLATPAADQEHQLRTRGRRKPRRHRTERVGQDDADPAHARPVAAAGRRRAPRRRGHRALGPRRARRARRLPAAGRRAVRRHRRREHRAPRRDPRSRRVGRHRARGAARARARNDPPAPRRLRHADRRRRRACCRAVSASASRSPARCTASRRSSCSTSRTRISTSPARPHSLAALADLKARGVTVIMVEPQPRAHGALDKLLVLKNGALEMFGPSAAVLARLRAAATEHRVVSFPPAKHTEASHDTPQPDVRLARWPRCEGRSAARTRSCVDRRGTR